MLAHSRELNECIGAQNHKTKVYLFVMQAHLLSLCLGIAAVSAHGSPPVVPGMRSFGTAVKAAKLTQGVEKTVFE
jgi:hypothetical protein